MTTLFASRQFWVTAALIAGLPFTALAQQAAPPAPPPAPPAREGTAEFSFVGTSGNTATQALGLGGELTLRRALWVYNTKAAYVRNESDDAIEAESFAALFQASRTLTERLSAFGRYTYLRNEFAGIDHRNVISSGVEYLLVQPEPHRLNVRAGIGYANEQRLTGDDLSKPELVTGASYKWTMSPTANLTNDFDISMALDHASDWRTANIAALTASLTTIFSLKLSNTIRYVHLPVTGFESTDTITSVALVAKY